MVTKIKGLPEVIEYSSTAFNISSITLQDAASVELLIPKFILFLDLYVITAYMLI